MKNYEKESFLKIFTTFLFTFIILWGVIFYLYYEENKDYIKEDLYYQMKNYAFNFKGDKFTLKIIKKNKTNTFSKLLTTKNGLEVYFPMPKNNNFILLVKYPQKKFESDLDVLKYKIFKFALIILLFGFAFSLYFSYYSLKPIQKAISLLETFLKDLIHDLHTPITSILLNTKILSKKEPSEELERIELSAKTISSLYKNLEIIKNQTINKIEISNIKEIIEQRVKILQKLYPKILITSDLQNFSVHSNQDAISRIIDNLLTNACKYNKKNGQVNITMENKKIIIKDTGIGIKNTKRVFQRYYKENERGLGLGMNIVKKLCDELQIDINIKTELNNGTSIELTFN
ncbi:MAG: HAMP domain-containing histidine kinase [Epsilonproteobacteria bacterium]|nr:HAMP domain-containing histidine kinase [Campylobacterota bacterium]